MKTKKLTKTEIKIDLNEFEWGFSSSVSGGRNNKATKSSRKDSLTSCRIEVRDKITNLKEEYHIVEGHYAKKEMQNLRKIQIERLILILIEKRKKLDKK